MATSIAGAERGGWQTIMEALTRQEYLRQGRRPTPSAGVDAQSVKTATQGKTKGSDAGKQIHERKRHVLVDTLGLVMQVLVTAADADDRDGLRGRLSAYFAGGVQRLKKLWVDSGYRGEPIRAWGAALKHSYKIDLEVVKKPAAGFAVVPRRWVVERTFAWLLNFRRHSKNYEVLPRNSEAFIQIAMIHLLLKRRAKNAQF